MGTNYHKKCAKYRHPNSQLTLTQVFAEGDKTHYLSHTYRNETTLELLVMSLWDAFQHFISTFSIGDYAVLSVNLLLIIFAKPIITKFSGAHIEMSLQLRIALVRGINIAIIVGYVYYWMTSHDINTGAFAKALSIVVIVYFGYLINYLLHYIISRSYGKQRTINDKITYLETYRTRALNLLTSIIVSVIAIVACVQQLGFTSLLEAGGVIGVLGVMIGLTHGSWAPDIISGLILLNSDIFEEGDVIEIDQDLVGLIYKIKMFHTEILNLSNNHRIMIRNAKLRDVTLHNLSKFASAKGLRECLGFNIGYDVPPERVEKLFAEVTQAAIAAGIGFEHQYDTELKLLDPGDHALRWGYIYYIKRVEQLVNVRREMRLVALKTANTYGISLATPLTHTAQIHNHTHSVPDADQPLPPAPNSR